MSRIPDELPMLVVEPDVPAHRAEQQRYRHDAFGVITMTTPTGGNDVMFGSDIKHNTRVRIEVSRAELTRNLSNDWHFGRGTLISFEMSHAQFANFITSSGNGSGTPVTLRYTAPRSAGLEQMPGIKTLETKADVFRREIKESAKRQLDHIQTQLNAFGAQLAAGKLSMKDAKAMHRNLAVTVSNLPSNMEYVVGQAEEALEKAVAASAIQMEAQADHLARRLGLDQIERLAEQRKQAIEGDKHASN